MNLYGNYFSTGGMDPLGLETGAYIGGVWRDFPLISLNDLELVFGQQDPIVDLDLNSNPFEDPLFMQRWLEEQARARIEAELDVIRPYILTGQRFDDALALHRNAVKHGGVVSKKTREPQPFSKVCGLNTETSPSGAFWGSIGDSFVPPSGEITEIVYADGTINIIPAEMASGDIASIAIEVVTLGLPKGSCGSKWWQFWKDPCFPPGTLILMADGSTKKIEDIEVGDEVMADDPENPEKPKAYKVEAVPKNWTKRLIHIDIDKDEDGKSDGHYKATGKHPFWTTKRGWQDAVDLKIGDELLTEKLEKVRVIGVVEEKIVTDTYNLSVAGVHTFYVVDHGVAVLVHNATIGLTDEGYWNYHLEDSSGNTYYHGMAGPLETNKGVEWRHANNYNRFDPFSDTLVREPGLRQYGEARIMEDMNIIKDGTLLEDRKGINKKNYRGNRQRGIGRRNPRFAEYLNDACP